MNDQQASPFSKCSKCGASIPADDLEQGLAVESNEQIICKTCVDAVDTHSDDAPSSKPQVIRPPIMQQNIYRYSDDNHADLNRFTFLTAGHVALHRRIQREQGSFDPPEFSHDSETKRLPSIDARKATRRDEPRSRAKLVAVKADKNRTPIFIGAAVAVVLVIIMAVFLFSSTPQNTDTKTTDTTLTTATPIQDRNDFPRDPLKAWIQAQRSLNVDSPLLASISDELLALNKIHLDQAATALNKKDSVTALKQLNAAIIPADALFQTQSTRKEALQRQRLALIGGTDTQTAMQDSTDTAVQTDTPATDEAPIFTPLAFSPIMQLSSEISADNTIVDDLQNIVARSTLCVPAKMGNRAALQIPENGSLTFLERLSYPHSFEIDFWFRCSNLSSEESRWLYAHGQQNTSDSINIYFSGNTLRTVIAFSDLNALAVQADAASADNKKLNINDDRWHHYTLSVDHANGARVYIDAQLRAKQSSISGPLAPAAIPIIGADYSKHHALQGSLARFQIFQGIRSAKQLQVDYQTALTSYKPNSTTVATAEADITTETAIDTTTSAASDSDKPEDFQDKSGFHAVSVKTPLRKDPRTLSDPLLETSWLQQGLDVNSDKNFTLQRVADLNGDGFNDLLVSTETGNAYAFNNGDGSFGEFHLLDPENKTAGELDCGDLNNDGFIDIILATTGRPIQIYYNDGSGVFTPNDRKLTSKQPGLYSINICDLNHDQRPDFYISLKSPNEIMLYTCSGDSGEQFEWSPLSVEKSPGIHGLTLYDINDDAHADIVEISTAKGPSIRLFGQNAFLKAQFLNPDQQGTNGNFEFVKHDNTYSIINTNKKGELIAYTHAVNTGLEALPAQFSKNVLPAKASTAYKRFFSADLDGDGNDEIVSVTGPDHGPSLFQIQHFQALQQDDKQSMPQALSLDLKQFIDRCIIEDLNGDGYQDIILYDAKSKENRCIVLIRQTEKIQQDSQTTNTPVSIPKTEAPMPVIMSNFKTKKRHALVSIFDKYFQDHSLPPQLGGDNLTNNFPGAIQAGTGSHSKSELEVEIDNVDVSNGSILLMLYSDDSKRKQLTVTLTDKSGHKSLPYDLPVTNNTWQTHSIHLRDAGEDFDSAHVNSIHIIDSSSNASFNFYLYRLLFYKDFEAQPNDLPSTPRLLMSQDTQRQKTLSAKYAQNQSNTLIFIHETLSAKDGFEKELSEALKPALGTLLTTKNIRPFSITEKWFTEELKPLLEKKKTTYVIFLGVGSSLLLHNGNSAESDSVWKQITQACFDNNTIPILLLGPGTDGNKYASDFWDKLNNVFVDSPIYSSAFRIDLRYPYITDGNFNYGDKQRLFADIARNLYEVLARMQDLPQ